MTYTGGERRPRRRRRPGHPLRPAGRDVRTHARPAANPLPQARAPRIDRLRSPRARHRIRRVRPDEVHHPLRAQHRPSPDRRIHALGQRDGCAPSGVASHRQPLPHPREARRQTCLRLRNHRRHLRIFARRRRTPYSSRPDESRPPRRLRHRQARPRNRDPQRSPHHPAHVPEAHGKNRGQARRKNPQLPDAAQPEASPLLRRKSRPLRAGRARPTRTSPAQSAAIQT